MMNYALEIEHLSKQYGSFRLDDVSLGRSRRYHHGPDRRERRR